MPSNLRGLRVLVTRPKPHGEMLCDLIQAAGGHPVYFPVIEIIPTKDANFKEAIRGLNQLDYLIFISPQAVLQSVKSIQAAISILHTHLKIAAIGSGTASLLRKKNIAVDLVPEEDWRTEGLLAMPEFHNVMGKKIGIVKGAGGRELLAETLRNRGAVVTEIIPYRRELPKINADLIAIQFVGKTLNAVIVTSNESLKNLETLIGEKNRAYLHAITLVVVSERISQFAKESGFQNVLVAKNASHTAIMEVLEGL